MYREELEREAEYLKHPFENLCFDVYLTTGTIIPLCFFMSETEEFISCCVTMDDGTEHLHIIPKKHIEFIKIVYEIDLELDDTEDEPNVSYS